MKCNDATKCKKCVSQAKFSSDHRCICSSNHPFYISSNNECITSCSTGFYYDNKEQNCIQCSIDECSNCQLEQNKCSQCKKGWNLYKDQCYKTCPEGTYSDSIDGDSYGCFSCDQNCITCSHSHSNCTQCVKGFLLNPKTGECFNQTHCKANKYWDSINRSCKSCHESCKECVGGSQVDCISCNLDKILFPYQGVCRSCDKLTGYMIDKKTKKCEKICNPYDNDCFSRLEAENSNCNEMNCKSSPTVKILLDSNDPYNLIVEYDRDMNPETFCDFEITFDKLLHYQFETDIRPLGYEKCLVHIRYKEYSFGDTVYIYFKDIKSVTDKFNNSLNESQSALNASITGYMLESETKEHYTQMSVLTARGFITLTSFVVIFTILLFSMRPGFILWSLIDFLQRLAVMGMLSSEIPFNIRTLFNALAIFNFEISLKHHDFPGSDFLRYSWVVIVIMVLLELILFLIAIFCRMFDFGGKHNLICSIRLRLFSLISISIVSSICISLRDSSDITSKILALVFGIFYAVNFIKIWQNLGQQNLENSLHTIELFNRYKSYLQEVNIKSYQCRLYEPIMIINKIIMVIVIILINSNPRVQFIILMLVETAVLLYINKYKPSETGLNQLNIVMHSSLIIIELVFLWIMDSPDVMKNFRYCWLMEIGIGLVVLYTFATGFNKYLMKILYNINDPFASNVKLFKDQIDKKNSHSTQLIFRNKKRPLPSKKGGSKRFEEIDEEEKCLKEDY